LFQRGELISALVRRSAAERGEKPGDRLVAHSDLKDGDAPPSSNLDGAPGV
jgi:hypothetical protein